MSILEPVAAEGQALAFQFDEFNSTRPYSDDALLATVLQDIQLSERQVRESALAQRWAENDRLYLFQVPQRLWEGTRTPRASLGVPLVLEHVNAINPQVMEVMFEEDPPFYALPYSGISSLEARAAMEILRWELDKAGVEREISDGSEDTLLDGTGVWKGYWEKKGAYLCPRLEYIERRHMYVDPSLRRSDIRLAKWVAHRMMMTPKQLDKLRGQRGYENIPPMHELIQLGINPREMPPPVPQETPMSRFGSHDLSQEFDQNDRRLPASIDPALTPLEVIEYVNEERIITVLQRKRIIRNILNINGDKVRYFSAYFIRVRGQFDGLGLGALLGNEQRLQQGVLNLLLDYLALSILGMFARRRGTSVYSAQVRVSPGKVLDVDERGDIEPIKLPSIDPQAFQAIADSDSRAARRSGANEVTVQGAFPDSSGGVGRTAAGMNALVQAASARIRDYVKTLEEQVLLPYIEFLVDTNPKYLKDGLVRTLLGEESELYGAYTENPGAVLGESSKMKFRMLGATKMKRRAAMLQSVPMFTQLFQSQYVQEALKGAMLKTDFNELIWMIFDATGWPNKEKLILPMDEEEQQRVLSENPLVQELMTQQAQTRIQTAADIEKIDAENAGRAMRDILKSMLESGKISEDMKLQLAGLLGQRQAADDMDAMAAQQGDPDAGTPVGY